MYDESVYEAQMAFVHRLYDDHVRVPVLLKLKGRKNHTRCIFTGNDGATCFFIPAKMSGVRQCSRSEVEWIRAA